MSRRYYALVVAVVFVAGLVTNAGLASRGSDGEFLEAVVDDIAQEIVHSVEHSRGSDTRHTVVVCPDLVEELGQRLILETVGKRLDSEYFDTILLSGETLLEAGVDKRPPFIILCTTLSKREYFYAEAEVFDGFGWRQIPAPTYRGVWKYLFGFGTWHRVSRAETNRM